MRKHREIEKGENIEREREGEGVVEIGRGGEKQRESETERPRCWHFKFVESLPAPMSREPLCSPRMRSRVLILQCCCLIN